MKKQAKKLVLEKETMRSLGVDDGRQVKGQVYGDSWAWFCLPTPSKFCEA